MSSRRSHGRFWVEVALASLAALLLVVTVLWPTWIETVFGVDPDQGDGSLEKLIALGAAAAYLILTAAAAVEWRGQAVESR